MGNFYENYMNAVEEGKEVLAFCKENNITSYLELLHKIDMIPEDRRDVLGNRIVSNGFRRFLKTQGIK